MPEPGAPHTPTVHPRTRPEAEENAMRGRATNDWFRHDGKNIDSPEAGHVRLASKQAHEIAAKYKGESDSWYMTNGHHQNGSATTPNKNRIHSAEAMHIKEKIAGKEEGWYKHEDNQNFVSPRPKSRLTSEAAQHIKENMVRDSTEWYKHDGHGTPQQPVSSKKGKLRTPTPAASENATKLRPTGLPIWASYSPDKDSTDGGPRPAPRLQTPDAQEYQQRSKGSAADWYCHTDGPVDQNPMSPRFATPEAAEIASKQRTRVEWFSHDDNKNYMEPVRDSRCQSAMAKEMRDRQRGQMDKVFHHEMNGTGVNPPPQQRIRPEAEDYAKKSVQGMMQKFLDQHSNQGYQSARPGPRVKPEAEEFAEKNKGVMDDCMGGYADTPRPHNQRRIRPEAEDIATRNKGVAGKVMNGDLPSSARAVSRIRPEAQGNANRNTSSALTNMMYNYGNLEVSGRPAPRNVSQEAKQNALRFQGTAADVMYNKP